MKTTILFDLDGTLTDPKEGVTKSVQFAFGQLGIEPPNSKTVGELIGPPLHESLGRFLEKTSQEHLLPTVMEHYRQRYMEMGAFENEVYHHVPALLTKLSKNHILFVATSKPTVFAEPIIRHFGLHVHFKKVYGSELSGKNSDKADLIKSIIENENLDPKSCLMIGDRHFDIAGAKKNSIDAIGITWGYGSREELEKAGALAVYDTSEEILQKLQD